MSMFSWLFGGRPAAGRPASARIYVVDATGLVEGRLRNSNGQANPRDNFQVLRNLAQFASREALDMVAVFCGRPLREASEGGRFKDIRVHYADQPETQRQKILTIVREFRSRKDVLVLVDDVVTEREAAKLGAAGMRLSTLRKAMEERDDREREGERHARTNHRRSPPAERPPERPVEPGERAPLTREPAVREPEQPARSEPAQPGLAARPESPKLAPAESAKPKPVSPPTNPQVLDLIDPL